MPGLLDAAPRYRDVEVGGTTVRVSGLSGLGLVELMQRFPEVKMMLAGKDVRLSPERMMTLIPEAGAAVIAGGCGHPGDPAYEQHAATLCFEDQVDLVAAVIELTIPSGIDPFMDKLDRLLGAVGLGDVESVAGGKAPDTKSSAPSKPASNAGTRPKSPGPTPPPS